MVPNSIIFIYVLNDPPFTKINLFLYPPSTNVEGLSFRGLERDELGRWNFSYYQPSKNYGFFIPCVACQNNRLTCIYNLASVRFWFDLAMPVCWKQERALTGWWMKICLILKISILPTGLIGRNFLNQSVNIPFVNIIQTDKYFVYFVNHKFTR